MKRAKKLLFGLLSGIAAFLAPLPVYASEETMAEKMTTAVYNTILGIGTVFIMLVVIAIIIYCFRFIPAILERFSKKKEPQEEQAEVKKPLSKPTPAPVPATVPVQTDDTELIAVIAAAIAASEQIPMDSFIVRTIKKRV